MRSLLQRALPSQRRAEVEVDDRPPRRGGPEMFDRRRIVPQPRQQRSQLHAGIHVVGGQLHRPPGMGRASVVITRDSLAPLVAEHGRVWMLAPQGESQHLADSLGLGYQRTTVWNREDLGLFEAKAAPTP